MAPVLSISKNVCQWVVVTVTLLLSKCNFPSPAFMLVQIQIQEPVQTQEAIKYLFLFQNLKRYARDLWLSFKTHQACPGPRPVAFSSRFPSWSVRASSSSRYPSRRLRRRFAPSPRCRRRRRPLWWRRRSSVVSLLTPRKAIRSLSASSRERVRRPEKRRLDEW